MKKKKQNPSDLSNVIKNNGRTKQIKQKGRTSRGRKLLDWFFYVSVKQTGGLKKLQKLEKI